MTRILSKNKLYEAEYEDLSHLVSEVVKALPLYFFVKDTGNDFRYVYASPLMKDIFGQPIDTIIGKNDLELFPDPESKDKFYGQDLRILRTGKPEHYTEPVIDQNGLRRIVETKKQLVRRKGKRLPYLIGMAWEVTRIKEIEEQLHGYNKRLALACQAGNIYPWVWDFANGTAELSMVINGQIQPVSIVHKSFETHVHPDERETYIQTTTDFVEGKIESFRLAFRTTYFTGKYVWFEQLGEIHERDVDGKYIKAIGLLRDITIDKRAEEDLKAKLMAEESDRMKSAFIANMSHEIRTPLNAIVGFSNLLSETEDPEERKSYVKIIESSNEYLLQLINDILDISRIDSGNQQMVLLPFSLQEVFSQQEEAFALRVEKGVEVVFEDTGANHIIVSEKTRFTQVLTNFLSNAVKFTSKGSIRFGYKPTDTGVYVYVADTGGGIKEKDKEVIFDRFVKLDSQKQGTGLGLSICKTVIHTLEGEIGVDSKEGEGSTFWFSIPCKITNESIS